MIDAITTPQRRSQRLNDPEWYDTTRQSHPTPNPSARTGEAHTVSRASEDAEGIPDAGRSNRAVTLRPPIPGHGQLWDWDGEGGQPRSVPR